MTASDPFNTGESKNTELGIDEAGRGSILGPMVLAGVVLRKQEEPLLKDWGVADSKVFGSSQKAKHQRGEIAKKIAERFQVKTIAVEAARIDAFLKQSSLNVLEQQVAGEICKILPADLTILDGERLFAPLVSANCWAINRADANYLCVAAASIVAKDLRDQLFEVLVAPFRGEYGIVQGGGYANAKTLHFVRWYQERFGELPPFYRRSYRWKLLPG